MDFLAEKSDYLGRNKLREVCSSNSSNMLKLKVESGAEMPPNARAQEAQDVTAHSIPISPEDTAVEVPCPLEESSTDDIDKPQDQAQSRKEVIDKPQAQTQMKLPLMKAPKNKVKNTWTRSTRATRIKPKKLSVSEEHGIKQLLLENCFAAASKSLNDRA